jgi:lipoprotein-anchoring transpeptidase ErfK/SrfK
MTAHVTRPTLAIVGTAVLAVALLGCGGGAAPADRPADADAVGPGTPTVSVDAPVVAESNPPAVDPSTTTASTSAPTTPTTEQARDVEAALRGVSLVDRLVVFDRPDGDVITELPARTPFDTPMVVGVIDDVPGWAHVLVPVRPNDLTGWVRAADIRLEAVDAAIHVDLASRTLRLTEAGVVVGEWPVAVGRPDRPTPTGQFFITDKLATGDPSSVWGAHAFGISAYSDVLDEFIGGIGQIGVHGTNDPSSIGQNVSSGCIRLPNEVIDELIDRLPLGTPVHIT